MINTFLNLYCLCNIGKILFQENILKCHPSSNLSVWQLAYSRLIPTSDICVSFQISTSDIYLQVFANSLAIYTPCNMTQPFFCYHQIHYAFKYQWSRFLKFSLDPYNSVFSIFLVIICSNLEKNINILVIASQLRLHIQ